MATELSRAFKGKAMIHRFLDRIGELDCGVDIVSSRDYQVPRMQDINHRRTPDTAQEFLVESV